MKRSKHCRRGRRWAASRFSAAAGPASRNCPALDYIDYINGLIAAPIPTRCGAGSSGGPGGGRRDGARGARGILAEPIHGWAVRRLAAVFSGFGTPISNGCRWNSRARPSITQASCVDTGLMI